MDLLFLGDVMPGGVLHYQDEYISNNIKKHLSKFDLRIATLETAIGDDFSFDEVKMEGNKNIIYSKNSDIQKIIDLNINVVSLANNHVSDLGLDGFVNTIQLLEKNNIKYCGAGLNINEASKPAVIELNGKTVAIYAYCQYGTKYIGYVPLATENHYGVNPLDIDRVVLDIKSAKKKYDYIVIMPHWGIEYKHLPTVECKRMAYRMIDAGADAVIGGHTHQIQPMIFYKGKPICFSLSNFMFPDYYMYPPRPLWYPDETIDREKIERVEYYPNYIETPVTQVWRDVSRIGMLMEISLENISKSKYTLSYLTQENVITFLSNERTEYFYSKLRWMGKAIKCRAYGLIYSFYYSRYYRLINRCYSYYKKIIN